MRENRQFELAPRDCLRDCGDVLKCDKKQATNNNYNNKLGNSPSHAVVVVVLVVIVSAC
jgi:hypothetical protein